MEASRYRFSSLTPGRGKTPLRDTTQSLSARSFTSPKKTCVSPLSRHIKLPAAVTDFGATET